MLQWEENEWRNLGQGTGSVARKHVKLVAREDWHEGISSRGSMGREIKFRAWAHASKVMFFPETVDGWELCGGVPHPLPNTTIMQYTGMKDKNGKEIFEGDILSLAQCKPAEYKVVFREGAFCLAFINGKFKDEFALDIHYIQHSGNQTSTIIGNIYENPELIAA